MILHKKKDQKECGNYRSISLVAHPGKILLKINAPCLSEFYERVGTLPEEPNRSTTNIVFGICWLQKLAPKEGIPLYVCFIGITKVYDSVDRTLLWTELVRFGVPQKMISVIRQFHDGIRTCVRLDDGGCSGWFAVKQDLRQGCACVPPVKHIFRDGSRLNVDTRVSRRTKTSWMFWCTFEEKPVRGGGGEQPPESQPW